MSRKKLLYLLSAAAAALPTSHASAQTNTWNSATTTTWSAGPWNGGIPPYGGGNQGLAFKAVGAQTYTATNDLGSPFMLNGIYFNHGGTGSVTRSPETSTRENGS